jgi:hypothetical protein
MNLSGTDTQGQGDEQLGAKTCKGFANTALSSCLAAASRDSVTVTLEKPRSKTNETHSFSLNKAFNLPQIYSSRRESCIVFPQRQLAELMLGSTASFPFVRQNKLCEALTSAYFFGWPRVNKGIVFKTPALSGGQFPFHYMFFILHTLICVV